MAAGKITGTAAGKDSRFYEACGARPVLDFTSAGYPSTYMSGLKELLGIYHIILGNLQAANPDYIILEIADGVFQRETCMLLESAEFRQSVDHVFFAASDSLSAESGVRSIRVRTAPEGHSGLCYTKPVGQPGSRGGRRHALYEHRAHNGRHLDRGARGWTYAGGMHEMTFSRQPTLCLLHVDDAAHPQMPAG